MSLGLIESAVDTLKAYLDTNLSTHIDAVNTAHGAVAGDAAFITAPDTYVSQQTSMPAVPFLMIMADQSSPTTDGFEHMKSRHDMTLIVIEETQSHDTMNRKLWRQVEALVKCIRAGRLTTLQLVGFNWPYASYGPIYTNSAERYRQDAQVSVWVELTEVA